MGKIEVRQHKVNGLKGGVNLCVWYKGKPHITFMYTVYPSQLHQIQFYKEELIHKFKLALVK